MAGESRQSQVKCRSPSTSSNKCSWQYNAETCSESQGLSSPRIHNFLIYIWVTSLTKLHSPTSIFSLQASCLRAQKKFKKIFLKKIIIIPWQQGKSLTWDVTVTDTVATHTFIYHLRRLVTLQRTPPSGRRRSTLNFNKHTRSSHWRSKRLDPLTSRRGISSRTGPPPRSHQRRQPSDFILLPANLHHAAAIQRYHVR